MSNNESSFEVQDGQRLVFIGDSITDCGRRDVAPPLGEGYVKLAVDLITAKYPQRKINFINRGINADVAPGLRDRWSMDVLDHRPDWVSVMVGINDLHRRFSPDLREHIPVDKYREAYLELLTLTKEKTNARIILMDPFFICDKVTPFSQQAAVLDNLPEFIAVVHEMAEMFETLHVPTHEIFQKQLRFRPAETFCPEPVHPNSIGHMVIANAWLETIGW